MQFTEEQKQSLQEAAEAMIEAARTIVDSVMKMAETIAQAVAAAAKDFYEYIKDIIAVIVKEKKKLQCNNWRRMHGMPMIKRKESRQERHKYDIIAKGKVKACKLTKKQKRCCKK